MLFFNFQISRFLISGGVSTSLHWGAMILLIRYGLDAGLSTAIGSLAGALVNYILQYRYTFCCSLPHSIVVPRYIASISVSWLANLFLFIFLYELVMFPVIASQLLTTALVTLINYYLYQSRVFCVNYK